MFQELALRYRGRKRGKIAPATEQLACDRIVYLPLDLAVLYSVVQNFRLDLAKGYHTSMTQWRQVEASYFREVQEAFEEDGFNHFPGDNAEPWIHLRTISTLIQPTARVLRLKQVFDEIFSRDDESLLDGELYPTPFNCVTNMQIDAFYLRMQQQMQMH